MSVEQQQSPEFAGFNWHPGPNGTEYPIESQPTLTEDIEENDEGEK